MSFAQSGATRPRRVTPAPPPVSNDSSSTESGSQNETPLAISNEANAANNNSNSSVASNPSNTINSTSTANAYALLQRKQYEAALKEAGSIAANDPNNAEAWKIKGFAELSLNKFADASLSLERALGLQRARAEEDPNTVDALAQALVRNEKFDEALPLLVAATSRAGSPPDAAMLFYRGLAEYRTGKKAEAEKSLEASVKANPKNAFALFYLGRIAYEAEQLDRAIAWLNRATLADNRISEAWALLAYSYLRRASTQEGSRARADNLNAVRAGENLFRVKPDESSAVLYAQALIRAEQLARAATVLERFAANEAAQGTTLFLLGSIYSRTKNYPKSIAALERAVAKTPEDANIYRELGYVYEVSKQYKKALVAYERGSELAPDDATLKESIERVRPYAR
ncbi:MAG: tetratricopeptide repeat protein [Pyrinomonadaceae bacterium]|nr:tetratricopeptide repeat protein [Pyrinomonadaceae bacterium]